MRLSRGVHEAVYYIVRGIAVLPKAPQSVKSARLDIDFFIRLLRIAVLHAHFTHSPSLISCGLCFIHWGILAENSQVSTRD